MKRSSTVALISALAVALSGAACQRRDAATQPPASPASSHPLRLQESPTLPTQPMPSLEAGAVTLVGIVQPQRQAQISLPAPARVVQVLVSAGDSVRQGSLLAQIDSSAALAQLNSARAAADSARAAWRKAAAGAAAENNRAVRAVQQANDAAAEAALGQRKAALAANAALLDQQQETAAAREGLAKANVAVTAAHHEVNQLQQLAGLGGVSRNDLEAAQAKLQAALANRAAARIAVARAMAGAPRVPGGYPAAIAQTALALARRQTATARQAVQQAEAQRASASETGAADVSAAAAQMRQADAGVQAAEAQLNQTDLRSPIAGVVTVVAVHAGETPQPGTPIISVESPSGADLLALVPARQMSLLHTGMSAVVQVETEPGRRYAARITQISGVAQPDGRTFRVQLHLIHGALRPAQTAHIRIPVRTASAGG
ncbi:MAG: efflux RND transporter periplasmic adaptor subunit [Armatimonadetes bacterium]|nr:efflux RND transporter periplasmic adaptor subunit [Armatimonadota bacterium]MDE2206838.1 efflux RND transporter periplasmic adaptor subunit [Armatimonadota bacterium]